MVRMARVGGSMQIGSLVDDGLDNIGIVTAVSKVNDLVFIQFLNAVNGSQSNGWYCEEDLEVLCK